MLNRGSFRVQPQCFRDQLLGLRVVTGLERDKSEQMQRVYMLWVLLQDTIVNLRGLSKAA